MMIKEMRHRAENKSKPRGFFQAVQVSNLITHPSKTPLSRFKSNELWDPNTVTTPPAAAKLSKATMSPSVSAENQSPALCEIQQRLHERQKKRIIKGCFLELYASKPGAPAP